MAQRDPQIQLAIMVTIPPADAATGPTEFIIQWDSLPPPSPRPRRPPTGPTEFIVQWDSLPPLNPRSRRPPTGPTKYIIPLDILQPLPPCPPRPPTGPTEYIIPMDILQPLSPCPPRPKEAENPDLCVPLYRAALENDWKAAKEIIDKEPSIVLASIAQGSYTALHVAAGAGHVHFVEKLMGRMNDLRLVDERGNTAFCVAAAVGYVKIAEIMRRKDPGLPKQRGFEGHTPLYIAALFGHQKMASYLYSEPAYRDSQEDLARLFFTSIDGGLYDLASKLLQDHPDFALKRNRNRKTALHLLAQKPSYPRGSPGIRAYFKRIRAYFKGYKNPEQALVKQLWHEVARHGKSKVIDVLTSPSHLLFDAMEIGNCKFVAQLIHECPGLIWEINSKGWTIIHAAVWHRHETIFSLIYEVGMVKNVMATTFKDKEDGSTLLHLAARLAPVSQLNRLAGAGFQMQRELLWFEEVKKIIHPSYIQMKNSKGETPQELFTSAHEPLLKDGREWMKGTAQSCTIISTLIASALFAGEVTVIMGDHPFKTAPFRIFIISDAIAFLLALTATLTFSAILTSRYAERDFLSALSQLLKMGLALLFFSITAMMFTFSSAFFIAYGRKDVFPSIVTGWAGVLVLIYVLLQFPLLEDIFASRLFKQSEPVLR
ncbi:hypothetical protein ACE6H2_006040 [Prunus campanulata]